MRIRSGLVLARTMNLLCVVLLFAVVMVVAGCGSGPFGLATEEDDKRVADEKAWDKTIADTRAEKAKSGEIPDDTVMKYEEGEVDPLVGEWSFPDMWASYPSYGAGEGLGPPEWAPRKDPTGFTVVKQAQGYSMKTGAGGTSTVTFDGKRMTLEYSYPTNSARYSGIVNGDTIVGSQHVVISEQTKKASVESLKGDPSLVVGPDVYDGPWTATRVK